MTKPFLIAPWVVPQDLQAIYDYHRTFSQAKADRIVAEYDRVIATLEINPLLIHERIQGWRVYPFSSGTYLLYYKEYPEFWLVTALFHARQDPNWITAQLSRRLPSAPSS
ncbi:MAG TPA: type II toxin-antitoxin system RelE/ParE family toxin [Rariglobus sp.]